MRGVAVALAAWLLAACTNAEVPPERLPRFEPPATHGGVALVLGSGGHRGFAHIGMLRVLDAEGLRPDIVVGSSVGALVGALYASGMTAAELESLAMELNLTDFFMELRVLRGLPASGEALQAYVGRVLNGRTIESLPLRFAAVATRVRDKAIVLFNRGDTGLAVRASGASPGLFDAVRIGDETYVDGDEVSPVPILAARRMGATAVVAIDVSAHLDTTPDGVPVSWIEKDERRARQVREESRAADVVVHPDLGYYVNPQQSNRPRIIAIAEEATRRQLPAIRAAFAQSRSRARMPSAEASR